MQNADDVFNRVLEVRGGTRAELGDRANPDAYVVRSRHLAAALLLEVLDNDQGRVQSRLDCSYKFIYTAAELAKGDATFQEQLDELKGIKRPGENPDDTTKPSRTGKAPKKPTDVVPAELLFRIASEQYGFDREEIRKNFSNTHRVRRILALIGKGAFSLKSREMADVVFKCIRATVTDLLQIALYDYSYERAFREEVDRICTMYDLTLDPNRIKKKHERAGA
jgi:hypothetical protein